MLIFGVFVFPGPRPSAWPPTLTLGPGPQFVLTGRGPKFVFTGLSPKFFLTAPVSPKPGLADTNLVPPICIYWPWPTIFITVL